MNTCPRLMLQKWSGSWNPAMRPAFVWRRLPSDVKRLLRIANPIAMTRATRTFRKVSLMPGESRTLIVSVCWKIRSVERGKPCKRLNILEAPRVLPPVRAPRQVPWTGTRLLRLELFPQRQSRLQLGLLHQPQHPLNPVPLPGTRESVEHLIQQMLLH